MNDIIEDRGRGFLIEIGEELSRLRDELEKVTAERDEALLRWQRLYGEIDCRVEHGANSNGHLEAIFKMMQKIEKGK
jgi:hypothetical protein